jgi:hypothetical protein
VTGAARSVVKAAVTALAVLGIPAMAAGCGGSDGGAADPVESYLAALADADGERACEQLSGEYKREFLASYMEGFPEIRATTCEDVVAKVSAMLGVDELQMLREAEAHAEVDGDRATVTIAGGTNTATVRRIDGRWLIVGGLNYAR